MSGDVGFNAVRKIVVMNVQYPIVPREAIYVSDYQFCFATSLLYDIFNWVLLYAILVILILIY